VRAESFVAARNVKRASSPPEDPAPSVAPPPPPRRVRAAAALRVLRIAMGGLMMVAIAGSVAWALRRYVTTSPRFAVSEIVTTGARRRSPERIALIASISKGQNVFSTDVEKARARLLADPWIQDATVSRQLPGTVFVRIVEREPAGLLATTDGTYLVTRDGGIVKRVEADDPTDLPIVTGVDLQVFVEDREGSAREVRRALDLAADYERSPLVRRSPLQEVHLEPNGDLTLLVGKSGLALRMGAPPYRRKLEEAMRVVAELDRRSAKADTVMLDNEARPDRVVVRMR
jgi:cell division protein FtsQ